MRNPQIFRFLEFIFIFTFFVLDLQVAQGQPPWIKKRRPVYSIELEEALRAEIFASYSVLQRPMQRVFVQVSLTLLNINEMDIKGQTLSISGYLTLFWLDSRLSWYNTSATSQDYSNVRFLFSTEQYVWRPAIIIENSVEDISVISDPQIPMRIASVGGITWSPSGIYKVSCESDTTYYPMDYQICTIKVSTWGYTSHEIQLVYDKATPVELGFYSPNGEWDLISGVGTTTKEKSRGGQTFSSLTFQVSLQRRPMFHILNTLFPVALMAFLIPLVFKLPPDSGEKIGYALTVLLAYAVYLTLISDNIPSTSVTICYLSIYLALTLMYGTLSVLFVILVLMAHHKPETEEVPGCVSSLISGVLMPLVCWNGRCCCCRRKKSGTEVTDITIPKNKVSDIALLKSKMVGISEKPKLFDDDEDDEKEEMTWPLVSEVLDKFFFNLVMFLVFVTTFVIFAIIVMYYATDVS